MFFIDIGQRFIDCFRSAVQILLGVSVANISMMVWGKKDASSDELSVEIVAFGFMGTRLIPLEGDEKHGCNSA